MIARVPRSLSLVLALVLSSDPLLAQSKPSDANPARAKAGRLTRPPELVEFVEADYPESERAAGRAAQVVLELAILIDGSVDQVRVVESAGPAFDAAAVDAVKRFRFTPALIDEKPAPVRIRYRYDFVLKEAPPPAVAAFSGVVRERGSNKPLAGVQVELDGKPSVVTDAEGKFRFDQIEPGSHTLVLSRADLRAMQTAETFEAGQQLDAIYEVEAAPTGDEAEEDGEDLEIVVVAPRLTKQVVSTQVVAEEAQRVAGTQGDVLKIVENLPGVTRATAGSGQLVVWGAAPEDTRVMWDGVELPALYHYGGVRSVIHGDLVQSVELLPGGYGPSYGRGTGGLVRVASRPPSGEGVRGSAQLDVLDASAAIHGPISEKLRASASVRKSHLGWLLNRVTSKDVGEFFPIPSYADASARVRYQADTQSFVELGGLASWDEVTRQVSSPDPRERKGQTRKLDFQRIFLRYQREPGNGSRVSVLPWYGRDQRSFVARFSDLQIGLRTEASHYGLRASYDGRLSPNLSSSVGLDLKLSSTSIYRSGSISSPAREGDATTFGQLPSDSTNTDRIQVLQGSAAPYAELDLSAFEERLHIVPGLRLEPMFQSVPRRQPQEGTHPGVGVYRADVLVEPRISLRYTPHSRVGFKLAVGRYHQAPLPEDLSAAFGNPLLGPASATHWLGGVNVRVLSRLSLETTAFYTRTSGLAVRNPSSSPLLAEALVDTGEGRAFGAQFLLRQEVTHGFFGWIAYTVLRSERRASSSADWRLFDYDQTHVLTALAAYELGAGFDIGLRARYATGYPRTPVLGAYQDGRRGDYQPTLGERNSVRLPDFVQLDARISKRMRLGPGELELYADVQNVTNRKNPEELVYSVDYSEQRTISGLPILPVVGARWSH